jgi:hypothetical protein
MECRDCLLSLSCVPKNVCSRTIRFAAGRSRTMQRAPAMALASCKGLLARSAIAVSRHFALLSTLGVRI